MIVIQNVTEMIRKIILGLLAFMFVFQAFAQSDKKKDWEKRKEQIYTQKVAFITQKLELSGDESQAFWPLYNEYESKKEEIQKSRVNKVVHDRRPDFSQLTNESADKMIEEHFVIQQKMLDLEKEFTIKLKKVLPSAKIVKLQFAEMEFKRQLLNQLRSERKSKDKK